MTFPGSAYYNEWEKFPAEWLCNLMAAGRITNGRVDQRSIRDVPGYDLAGYERVHLFAGIAGWELALELAGWPKGLPVWTGSCPCQPFSTAGKGKGVDDERHLWPEMLRLIDERRPPVIFGEQVASKSGRAWLAALRADLEALGYAVGAADLCAAGVGAPHIRQRLWWVAHAPRERRTRLDSLLQREGQGGELPDCAQVARGGADRDGIGHAASLGQRGGPPDGSGLAAEVSGAGCEVDPWANPEWLPCSDGKARPTQPGLFPLVARLPGRVGQLRAYGNAIVPILAATFVRACMDAQGI